MHAISGRGVALAAALFSIAASSSDSAAQAHPGHSPAPGQPPHEGHEMFMRQLGANWHVMGMSQLYPIFTVGFGGAANEAVSRAHPYVTQPVLMFNVETPASRVVLRTTLNLEGVTQPDGELTFGTWGEGFLDKRHPHTLLHEAMLSLNFWNVADGALSLSAGKGFAPFGTDDPMSRPIAKFPTNHHLSQILERFTASIAYRRKGWSIEAATFGGNEPTGPFDMSNIESFPNSWSARLTRRFAGDGPSAAWEIALSYSNVVEMHDNEEQTTRMVNGYIRYDRVHSFGHVYSLLEASTTDPASPDREGHWAVVGEAQLRVSNHQPYVRAELATRPEYTRAGTPGTAGFYRYDHDAASIGATRWFIGSAGYNYHLSRLPMSARPFLELQFHRVGDRSGGIAARELFGATSFFSLTTGVRLYMGGGPKRMGSYGVLDAMTDMMQPMPKPAPVTGNNQH